MGLTDVPCFDPTCPCCNAWKDLNDDLSEVIERIRFFAFDDDLDAIKHDLNDSPIKAHPVPEWAKDLIENDGQEAP